MIDERTIFIEIDEGGFQKLKNTMEGDRVIFEDAGSDECITYYVDDEGRLE